MWEQIRANRRKSIVLVIVMAALLLTLGSVIGEAYAPGAGVLGFAIAFAIWIFMSLLAYFQGKGQALARPNQTGTMGKYIEKTKALPEADRKALVDFIMGHKD